MTTSTATVVTDRPARYGRQLTSHMARRSRTTWDERSGSGSIVLGGGEARAELTSLPGALGISLLTAPDLVEQYEEVIGIHLARFGARDALVVPWVREDGAAGTTQGPIDPDAPREHHGERRREHDRDHDARD